MTRRLSQSLNSGSKRTMNSIHLTSR
ncbi:hypothetical protein LINPERHAP2_LOCUS30323 [Linum perenne]